MKIRFRIFLYLAVRNAFPDLKIILIFCISLASRDIHAQLGFCQGNSGDPIFTETFGTAPSAAVQYVNLPSASGLGGTTNYNYVAGPLSEGQYHITNGTNAWNPPYDWHAIPDHTDDTNGRMLVANGNQASLTNPQEFFNIDIGGLCETTT